MLSRRALKTVQDKIILHCTDRRQEIAQIANLCCTAENTALPKQIIISVSYVHRAPKLATPLASNTLNSVWSSCISTKYRTLHYLNTVMPIMTYAHYRVCSVCVTSLWRQSLFEYPSLPPTADAFTLQAFRYGIGWRFGTWGNKAALCESWRQDKWKILQVNSSKGITASRHARQRRKQLIFRLKHQLSPRLTVRFESGWL